MGSCPDSSDRIARIRAATLSSPYSICLERPTLLQRFWRTSTGRRARGEHPTLRRAMALAHVLGERTPRIHADELIVGNMSSKRIAANYYPEGGSVNILEDIFRLERRRIPLRLSWRERLRLLAVGVRGLPDSVAARALLRPGRLSHFLDFFRARRYFVTEAAGIGHQVGGYRDVVHHGLVAADRLAADRLERGAREDGTPLDGDQIAFYESIRVIVAGVRQMAGNLAAEAERIAASPRTAPDRRAELLSSARACRRVPHEPARTLQEGLQACWIVHVALNLEDFEQGLSFGRLDQILFPLYRRDVDEGRLTPEGALELLACFQLKTCETIPLYSERIDRYFSGNAVAQGITLGGTDVAGEDATNGLSGLFLDAYGAIRTREPAMHVRVHPGTPRWFIDKAAAVLQAGGGKPSFFNDTQVERALRGAGISSDHARDYAVIGCVEMASQGRTYNSSDAALFNLPLCLELALNRGRTFSGQRIGPRTPPPERMRSLEELLAALDIQVRDAVSEAARVIGWLEQSYRETRTTPVNSAITAGCLELGRDVTWGGALYDFTSIQAVGLADTGDSLHAIRRLVFDEGRLSLEELVSILASNFDGHEPLRVELARRLPRFGNGDAGVDRMTQRAVDIFSGAVTAHRNTRGGRYIAGVYSMTCHSAFGRHVGALPTGRLAGQRLSNGLSPGDGADRRGPTGVLRSAAGLDTSRLANCYALNLKFERAAVSGAAGRHAIASLLQTYFDTGGAQVQINVLDAAALREAREDPRAHPGLVVRVAGYCAAFNELQPEIQDEIIARTAHGER